jgi:hypothetical protein
MYQCTSIKIQFYFQYVVLIIVIVIGFSFVRSSIGRIHKTPFIPSVSFRFIKHNSISQRSPQTPYSRTNLRKHHRHQPQPLSPHPLQINIKREQTPPRSEMKTQEKGKGKEEATMQLLMREQNKISEQSNQSSQPRQIAISPRTPSTSISTVKIQSKQTNKPPRPKLLISFNFVAVSCR